MDARDLFWWRNDRPLPELVVIKAVEGEPVEWPPLTDWEPWGFNAYL